MTTTEVANHILKARKRASFPSRPPSKFELVNNLKSAKTLGLTIPPLLLAIANQVIE
jgi:putative tryptophan/tyrosine transport system substrate-binding protein